MQPYLDSDMQSRWWDFGGDTIIRADQYALLYLIHYSEDVLRVLSTGMFASLPIGDPSRAGSSHAYL